MARIQVRLTEEQVRELKRIAAIRGLSLAELIRQSVDQFIQAAAESAYQEKVQKLRQIAGKYSVEIKDLAEKHDEHLNEIYRETGI